MRPLSRSMLVAVCSMVFTLVFAGLAAGAEPPAGPPTDPQPSEGSDPTAATAEQPTDPDSGSLPQAIMCLIDADCADGSQVSCVGTRRNCSRGSEPCTEGGCSGTRNFVECDGVKTFCSICDVGSCCSASTTCSDGSTLSCTGEGSCQQGSESCMLLDCSGTRKFVQCGSTKKVCGCDIGSCQPCQHSTCVPGASCTTQEECGPCGSCEFDFGSTGSCLCIILGGP